MTWEGLLKSVKYMEVSVNHFKLKLSLNYKLILKVK